MKRAKDLIEYAISTVGSPYMYGNNGWVITEALIQQKKKQYPKQYTDEKIAKLRKSIGKKGYQCNTYLSVFLGSEKTSDQWRDYGTGGSLANMPDIPGLSVFYPGHTGIYIGDGKVVEARGTFYGVVITNLRDRPWTQWRSYKEIDYGGEEEMIKRGMKDNSAGGSAGTAVSEWQETLTRYDIKMIGTDGKRYTVDGSFGSATENGTKEFQRLHNLSITGVVDLETISFVLADARKKYFESLKIVQAIKLLKEVK